MRRLLTAAGAVALAFTLSSCASPRWQSTLVSANAARTNSGNGPSYQAALSTDGSTILFTSHASNLGPADTVATCTIPPTTAVNCADVYVHDRAAGTNTLVSVNAAGTNGGNLQSVGRAISADGTKALFLSLATDLVANDTNSTWDVFVRDLDAGTTTLISANAAATGSGNVSSFPVGFSPDATKVYFESDASNLVANDTNNSGDIFVRDLVTGTTTLLTPNAAGTASANDRSDQGVVSPDGTKLAFRSEATDLGPPSLGAQSIYVRDLGTGETVMASVNNAGDPANGGFSFTPVFSPDGSRVGFTSSATNLAPGDANDQYDAFVHDLTTSTTTLVSVAAGGGGSSNGESTYPEFGADSNRVVFTSQASNLGPADSGVDSDVYMRDLSTGTTTLISVNAAGTDGGDQWSFNPIFSPIGDKVVFQGASTNLVPEGAANGGGLFVRDLVTGKTAAVSTTPDGSASNGAPATYFVNCDRAVFSADGAEILYETKAGNLGATDTARGFPTGPTSPDQEDIYIARLPS